ncbi:hypothetical protein A2310_02240 [candidate division WOR-1 bacterium RIFOXYB2_FULL_37_13]|uniref:SHS2 domain-containing protein n=1 Tax=candidate division WOR-1 bacterium RIFOXYB2_FULL_37_13 TaxID=1802579 RepID=A0A1F4SMG7_UNCSA|nr:MAG: hypothetical protein A2310_02240 [candidate division WOR-1 bacterium RIFOXYB2_FULL_37_13]
MDVVELDVSSKEPKILNWALSSFSSNNLEPHQIKELFSPLNKQKFYCKKAKITLLGSELIYKIIKLPNMPQNEVISAIRLKLEDSLSIKKEEIIFDYYKIHNSAKTGKQLFLVVATDLSYIKKIAQDAKEAGFSACEIIPPSWALKNIVGAIDLNPSVLIYLGQCATVVVLTKNKEVVFAREFKIGIDAIVSAMTQAIATESGKIELDCTKASKLFFDFGIPLNYEEYAQKSTLPAADIMSLMMPPLEKIGAEILRTIAYYREEMEDDTEFKKAYFTGLAPKVKNFIEFFKNEFGFDVEVLPLNLQVNKDFEESAHPLALALGAALSKDENMSLLPYELRNPLFKKAVKIFATWGIASVIFISMFFAWFFFCQKEIKTNLYLLNLKEQMKQQGIDVQKSIEKEKALASLLAEATVYEGIDRYLKIMVLLKELTPSDVYYKYLNYDNSANKLIIKGISLKKRDGKFAVSDFMDKLKATGYFKTITLSSIEESDRFNVPIFDFYISCDLIKGKI